MDKLYLVEARFSDFESSWMIMIGLFGDKELANKHKTKWNLFFKENQCLFDEPKDWKPNEDDYSDDWEDSGDYFKLKMKYDEIKHFDHIEIKEIELNKDVFNTVRFRTKPMEDILLQWDRDYKINEII